MSEFRADSGSVHTASIDELKLEACDRPTQLAPKTTAGVLCQAQPQDVITNICGVKIPQALTFERYDVSIEARRLTREQVERKIDLTKKSKSDVVLTNRKTLCRALFRDALAHYQFCPPAEAVYDLQSTLFVRKAIDPRFVGTDLQIESPEAATYLRDAVFYLRLKEVGAGGSVRSAPQSLPGSLSGNDPSDNVLVQFLELLTSQKAYMDAENHITYPGGKSYLLNPTIYGFSPEDCPDLGNNRYLSVGCQKSVRMVEGPQGRGHKRYGVVIDTKKTPFHFSRPAIELYERAMNPNEPLSQASKERMRSLFVGLTVEPRYDPLRPFVISQISNDSANTKRFIHNGEEISVADYFRTVKNIALNYPDLNLVIESSPSRNEYPVEVLNICDNQRVRTEHQTPELVQKMIRACAVPPAILVPQNINNAYALGLSEENLSEYLKAFEVEVKQPMALRARVLPAPPIIYKGNSTVMPDNRATWNQRNGQKYLVPASFGKWALYLLGRSPGRTYASFAWQDLASFKEKFQQQCYRMGMEYTPPSYESEIPVSVEAIEAEFKACKGEGYTFIFFIHTEADNQMHKIVKLFERQFSIVTQLIKMQNASDIVKKGKIQTMENIVHKTNIKLGGVNYNLQLPEASIQRDIGENTLCIGVSVNHPGAINPSGKTAVMHIPTIVGYAANDKAVPYEFVGGFRLQKPCKEERISILNHIVTECVERFIKNRGVPPTRLFLFRNGCSEGQFGMVIRHEIPLVTHALREKNLDTKVTVIIPNRMHNLRFMNHKCSRSQRPPDQNVRPGTVIDDKVVHPKNNEFYLNSHVALQGTAKTPRYTVVFDQNNLSSDAIQLLCFTLCFGHQIVRLPTSLPSPVYIATRYAERGRALLAASSDVGGVATEMDNFIAASNELPYYKNPALRDVRINA